MWPFKREEIRIIPHENFPIHAELPGKQFKEKLLVKDISTGGIGVFIPNEFRGCEIGNEIDIRIYIPNESPFKVRSVIRHTALDDTYFGAQFLDLDIDQRKKIELYILSRFKK